MCYIKLERLLSYWAMTESWLSQILAQLHALCFASDFSRRHILFELVAWVTPEAVILLMDGITVWGGFNDEWQIKFECYSFVVSPCGLPQSFRSGL